MHLRCWLQSGQLFLCRSRVTVMRAKIEAATLKAKTMAKATDTWAMRSDMGSTPYRSNGSQHLRLLTTEFSGPARLVNAQLAHRGSSRASRVRGWWRVRWGGV